MRGAPTPAHASAARRLSVGENERPGWIAALAERMRDVQGRAHLVEDDDTREREEGRECVGAPTIVGRSPLR
jgi:hypothetical protein